MQNIADVKFWIAFFRARFNDLNEEGASAVEYGLLVSLIAVAIITAVSLLGTKIHDVFTAITGKVSSTVPTT